MNKRFEEYKKMRDAKRTKLNSMAKQMKLKVTQPYGPLGDYVFTDARRNNIFGHAADLDSAIDFLKHRFPQLAKEAQIWEWTISMQVLHHILDLMRK